MLIFKVIFSMLAFVLGASFASFAGVVAFRFPKGISLVKPNSYCPHCRKEIRKFDNIPILSWILLGGKCRYCNSKIGAFSFLIEIFGGVGFMLTYWEYGDSFQNLPILVAVMLLIFLFIIISAIDYETHNIYNITLIIFLFISVFITAYRIIIFDSNVWSHFGGAILGFSFFGSVKFISKLILNKDALGSGDVYLVGIGGLMIGAFPLLIAIIIATFLGSVIEIIKIKTKKSEKEVEIAFGPYLLFGMALMSIYGDSIMKLYWEIILNAII